MSTKMASWEALPSESQVYTFNDGHPTQSMIRQGTVDYLSPWGKFQRWRQRSIFVLVGWRWGLKLGLTLSTMVLIINTAVTIKIVLSRGGADSDGKVSLMDDKCERVKKYNTIFHLTINVLSTLLLGSSNYVIQCLCAPTRSDINKAHEKGIWLDIGISSMKNLKYMHRGKLVFWFLLVASSWPLHLFFNSAVFATIYAHSYDVYSITGDLSQPNALDQYDAEYIKRLNGIMKISDIHSLAINKSLIRLSRENCIGEFGQPFQSSNNLLLLVLNPSVGEELKSTTSISKSYSAVPPGTNPGFLSRKCPTEEDPLKWLCDSVNTDPCFRFCKSMIPQLQSNATWKPFGTEVDYCLVNRAEQQCTLNFSLHIMIIVIIMNASKAFILLLVGLYFTEDPILTLGDAVGSFLTVPDVSTRPANLRINTERQRSPLLRNVAISSRRWVLCISVCLAATIFVGSWFFFAFASIPDRGNVWKLGFGAADPRTLIYGWGVPSYGAAGIIANALIANLAQPLLSLVYFTYNNFLTAMISASEWDNFALFRKGLRVSGQPRGEQRVTHFLQLPYRYSIPLMAFSTLLHWLISQSIFVVSVVTDGEIWNSSYSADQARGGNWITCGFALTPMLIVFLLGFVLVGYAIFIGRGQLNSNIPICRSNSKNIAIECHPEPFSEGEVYRKLQWGPRRNAIDGSVQYAFSSAPVDRDIVRDSTSHARSRFPRMGFRMPFQSYESVKDEEVELQQRVR